MLLRHSQQKHCLHVVALLLHSVVQSSFCNGSLATLQAGPTGRTISALIAATRNMRSFIRKDHSFIAGKHALPIGRQGGERRSGRQSANQHRRRASHTPFPLLLAQQAHHRRDGTHSMRSSMKTTPPSPVSVYYRESEKEETGNQSVPGRRPGPGPQISTATGRHTFYLFFYCSPKQAQHWLAPRFRL